MTAIAAPLCIFLIAGEPSGDALGASLIRALRQLSETDIEFIGVGGPKMIAEGFESIFPIDDIAVMGIVEVIPKIKKIRKLIDLTAQKAIVADPAVVVSIDCPDFSKRVIAKIRSREPSIPLVHYVAPSVWAWRSKRAKKIARKIDHLIALLPFEPPYFEKHQLPTTFVGHPIAENEVIPLKQTALFREGLRIDVSQPVIVVLFGSRKSEVKYHTQVFYEVLKKLNKKFSNLKVVIPLAESVATMIIENIREWPFDIELIDPRTVKSQDIAQRRKLLAFTAADAAVCVSGTVSLELASCGTPMVVVYKTHPVTAFIVKRLIKINTATIVNLVAEENIVPEFFQNDIDPHLIAEKLYTLMTDRIEREQHRHTFTEVLKVLGRTSTSECTPSMKAARVVLDNARWKKDYYEDSEDEYSEE